METTKMLMMKKINRGGGGGGILRWEPLSEKSTKENTRGVEPLFHKKYLRLIMGILIVTNFTNIPWKI